jgi:hypothetical protein
MIRSIVLLALAVGACSDGSMDALIAQRQLIRGKWNCDFPNMKPTGETSLEFMKNGRQRQVTLGVSTIPGPSMQMHAEQLGTYSVRAEGLITRAEKVVIHQMTIDGQAAPTETIGAMEQGMLGNRDLRTSRIVVLDEHNLVLMSTDTVEPQDLKCTREKRSIASRE